MPSNVIENENFPIFGVSVDGEGYPLDREPVTTDTENANGLEAPAGEYVTSSEVSNADTTIFGGGAGTDPHPTLDQQPVFGRYTDYNGDEQGTADVTSDTTSAGVNNDFFPEAPVNTDISGTIPTTNVDQPLGVMPTDNLYIVPAQGAPGSTFDTTRSDQIASSGIAPIPTTYNYSETVETSQIGTGYGAVPVLNDNVPDAPDYIWINSASRGVRAFWAPSPDPENAPIRGYIIELSEVFDGNYPSVVSGTYRASRNEFFFGKFLDALPNVDVRVRVYAINDNGTSEPSNWSGTNQGWNPDENDSNKPGGYTDENARAGIVDPYGNLLPGTGAPSAPTSLATTYLGNGEIDLAWTEPTYSGGSPLDFYVVFLINETEGWWDTWTTSNTYKNMDYDFPIDCTYSALVFAINDDGLDSPVSNEIVFYLPEDAAPKAPIDVAGSTGSGVGEVDLTWDLDQTGGSAITDYIVTPYLNGVTAVATQSTGNDDLSLTLTGLTAAASYTFKVAAVNAQGTSPQSEPSAAIIAQD